MEEKIIEIHNLSALTGWYFDNLTGDSLADYEAAVCLALISTMDDKHGLIEKKAVPVKASELANIKVGETFIECHDELITLEALKVRFE